MGALKRLAYPYVIPNSSGWGVPNWNFSVVASSGDPDEEYNVTLYVGTSWPPTTVCNSSTSPTCYNRTNVVCANCVDQMTIWFANFTCANIGTWYYRFGMGNYYEETIKSITVTRDNVNISHLSGSGSSASLTTYAIFNLSVFDLTKNNSEISNSLYIRFNVSKTGLSDFKDMGSNLTNASGNVIFSFLPDTDFTTGERRWFGYVDTTASSCYAYNFSENYTVNVNVEYNAPPNFYNESVWNGSQYVTSGATAGWGNVWNFSVKVNDAEGENLNISLQVNTTGSFQEIGKANCSACSAITQFNFSYDNFTCSDINPTAYYRFVIIDNATSPNTNTTTPHAFTIERDDVTFEHILGNYSIANRSLSQVDILEMRLYDSDNKTYAMNLTNITFSVMRDSITWGDGVVNTTNASGNVKYNFDATCSPRYEVGNRNWKAQVLSSTCYKDTTSSFYNLTIMGDITPTLTKPKYHYETGGQNFSQEQTINFLGSSVDDCGTALTLNVTLAAAEVQFYMSGAGDYNCTQGIELVGSNAYSCDLATTITTSKGWYNVSIFTNKSYHYSNLTYKTGDPGVFYLLVKRRLDSPSVVPNSSGWGYPNWNFSIVASSGDPSVTENITLHIGTAWPPGTAEECNSTTCYNGTSTICTGCQSALTWWLRNFSSTQQGTWYYRFKLGDTFEDTIKSVTLTKDNTNISYVSGNNTILIKDTQPQKLVVRIYDLDKGSYNVIEPSALVNFKALHSGYSGGEKLIGTNTTNSTGYAEYNWNITDCNWQEGNQYWKAEINTTETNYKNSSSENYTITVTLTGCEATIDVVAEQLYTPSQVFQNKNFSVNASVTAWIANASNVNVTLNTSAGTVYNQTQFLGNVSVGEYKSTTWQVNPTSYGRLNVSVYANSTNAGNDTAWSNYFEVYKEKPETSFTGAILLNANEEAIRDIACSAGNYRVAKLNLTLNTTETKIRVYVYNQTDWLDILHSMPINTNGSFITTSVPVLQNQIYTNETERCRIKIKNVGTGSINISSLSLGAYYEEAVKIIDIIAKVSGTATTGIETSEKLFNVSVKIANSVNSSYSTTLYLNITNSSNYVVNSSSQSVNIPANTSTESNFTNINTTWNQGVYTLKAYLSYNGKNESRIENLIFKNVSIAATSTNYICNATTENFNVIITNPFTDTIEYNVSLQVPSGWSYVPISQIIITNESKDYTAVFNLTSGQTAASTYINASVSYTYPSISKQKNATKQIENGNISILEVVRETPYEIGNGTEFFSRLIVHNKGCASASSNVSFTEKVSSGWTAYEQTLDGTSAGVTDIPSGEIRFSTSDFGAIDIGEYKIISYKILPSSQTAQTGTLRYNLTWENRNLYEERNFEIRTMNYTNESHLVFDLSAAGSHKKRSAQPDQNQSYNLVVKNIGDVNISSGAWNVTLFIPPNCSASNYSGTWNETTRKINWQLGNLSKAAETNLTLNMSCPAGGYSLSATGISNTRAQTTIVNNSVNLGCSGADCENIRNYTFPLSPGGLKYESHSQIDFYIFYNWTGYGLTIGEGYVGLHDDMGSEKIIWQNYSHDAVGGRIWSNYTFDESDTAYFSNPEHKNELHVHSYSDGTYGATGNVTIEQIANIWNHGRLFNDTQPLFVRVKTYVFVPNAPILQAPPNASTQVSSPIVLSWFPSTGATSYLVYGDNANGDTFLGEVDVTNYLWSLTDNGLYKWKVKASAGGQNSSFSNTWQFTLDQCGADSGYAYALSYPMNYSGNVTDTITVIGNSTMGTASNPITFERIYEFGKAVRGICAVTKPASGIYVVKSKLVIGNGTQQVYVVSRGESISFTSTNMSQLLINKSASLTFGGIADGIPQEGSSIKFTSNQSNDILLDVAGGELAFYDSYISDIGGTWGRFMYTGACGNSSEGTYSNVNSSITIKKSTFDRATRGQFFYTSNVTIDDMKVNRINSSASYGYGIVAGCNMPTLNNLQIYHQEQNGSGIRTLENMPNNTDITITSSTLDYNIKDIIATKEGRGVQLINTQWDRAYAFNWTGNFSGTTTIKESYGYVPTFIDSASVGINNLRVVILDQYGNIKLSQNTSSLGEIGEQYIATWQVEKTNTSETATSFNPFTLYAKKYGKTFVSEPKTFAARTIETKQMLTNSFVTKTEAAASALTNILYNPPIKVSYNTETNSSWQMSGQLKNYPIDQCQYFALFANSTKLVEISNYTINYQTGAITFIQNMSGYTIYPTYFYDGNVTVTNGFNITGAYTMNDIYDYTQNVTSQNNLTHDIYTVDGKTYTFCVNFVIGNGTAQGSITDSDASLTFKTGYALSFSGQGGYVDLVGITAGGGSGGGLPLNIFSDVGNEYAPGNTVYIFATTLDSSGNLVSSTVNTQIYLPNGTLYTSGSMTEISTGRFRYGFTLPEDAQIGTWRVDIGATYSGNSVYDNLAFMVTSGGGGTNPSIEINAPSVINTNTNFGINAFVRNNNSLLVNCGGNIWLTLKDNVNGSTILSSVVMTNYETGKYNYTTSLSYQSTFLASANCSISGTLFTSNPVIISSQNVPGGGAYPTIELQASTPIETSTTATIGALVKSSLGTITNCDGTLGITFRNLADGISSSGNMTNFGTGMYNYSWQTPSTTSVFYVNASCSISGTSYTGFTLLSTQPPGSSLTTNVSNILGNVTFIIQNMLYQSNATGAFLVDYMSTVFTEIGKRAELWMLTRDLLGNPKTATEAVCDIRKQGTWIANATTTINLGSVYAYWNVSENILSGVYYWNCTLTGSSVSLQVPFFVSGEFGITSLVSASPKYPNENAIVEATFANQNGSAEPDTINLTIWKPNYLTIWKSANKNNFSIKDNNVWYWADTIESNPTTGTYYVHLTASYNNITDSKTTQFRIATGGPYMVFLECPSSSNVGENLACTVKIQDEGEAQTESTSTVWVDTDGDSIADAGEPQTSFSLQTSPLQNVTKAVSINVPSSHSTGSYVVRVTTSYANSGQPDSTASDSVTFASGTVVTSPSGGTGGGGGGGGGGGSSTTETTIIVNESQFSSSTGLTSSLKTNDKFEVTFNPSGATSSEKHTIKILSVRTSNITVSVSSTPIIFDIKIGEEKKIDINNDRIYDVYLKLNNIQNGKASLLIKQISGIVPAGEGPLTGGTIMYPEHLMDINTEIVSEYLFVYPGEKIMAKITLYNFGTEEIKEAVLTYYIENSKGEIILKGEETIAVYMKSQILKKFIIPSDTLPGIYIFHTDVSYNSEKARSEAEFEVLGKEVSITEKIKRQIPIRGILIGLGIIASAIILWIIIKKLLSKGRHLFRFWRRKPKPRYIMGRPRFKPRVKILRGKPHSETSSFSGNKNRGYVDFTHKKRREDLNKLIDYIKGDT